MSWHIPENELAGTPYAIAVTDPGASSGARTVAVTGWPSGWTSFPKIVVAIRSGQIVAAYEATAYSGGNLSLSGVIDGYTDAALLASDTIELRPTKLAITEIQSAVTTNTSSISTINTTLGTLGSAAFVSTSTFDAAGAAAAAQAASQPLSSTLTSLAAATPVAIQAFRPANVQTGTTYTFVLGDNGQLVTLSNASAVTATIPPHSSVAWPVGARSTWPSSGPARSRSRRAAESR